MWLANDKRAVVTLCQIVSKDTHIRLSEKKKIDWLIDNIKHEFDPLISSSRLPRCIMIARQRRQRGANDPQSYYGPASTTSSAETLTAASYNQVGPP